MPVPPLTTDGWLPPGEHECSLDEIAARFGGRGMGKRYLIMRDLRAHLTADITREMVAHVYVDGSFVSSAASPNDVYIVLGLREGVLEDLLCGERSSQAHAMIPKLEGKLSERLDGKKLIQGFVAKVGDPKYEQMRTFFQHDTREGRPSIKGILKVTIE